jgi:outer membrane protein assembly factor BamB
LRLIDHGSLNLIIGEDTMKRLLSILIVLIVTAMLSGCILSKTPKTNNVTMNIGEQKSFSINVFPSKATYTWTLDGSPLSNTTKSYTYTALAGEHFLVVRATQAFGTDTQTWNVYGNSPPVANAGPDQTVPTDTTVTLDGSSSTDPDSNIVSIHWQQTGGPAVTLTNADAAIAQFTASVDKGSVLTFELTVTDAGGLQSKDTCVITIIIQEGWPMLGYDAQHTGQSPYIGVRNPELKWSISCNCGGLGRNPAIGQDGTIYCGSTAYDGLTGNVIWNFWAWYVPSVPAIGIDNTVYITSLNGNVYALDGLTGEEKWEFHTVTEIEGSVSIGKNGNVYFAGDDYKVHCLNSATGNEIWEFDTGILTRGSVAIGHDGTVYVGGSSGKVYAIDGETGDEKWEFIADNGIDYGTPSVGLDGTVYIGDFGNKLYALNGQTGEKKWDFVTDQAIQTYPSIGSDGTVYVASSHIFYALDGTTGIIKWEFPTTGAIGASAAISVDGIVYFGSSDGVLYALDSSNGDEIWEYQLAYPIGVSPSIGSDGMLYVENNEYFGAGAISIIGDK